MVKDIYAGPWRSLPEKLTVGADGLVYFLADDGIHGNAIWRSDGTEAGTTLFWDLSDLNASAGNFAIRAVSSGRVTYVRQDYRVNELWSTDGTSAGTVLLHQDANWENFVVHEGKVYYTTISSVTSNDLWTADGGGPSIRVATDLSTTSQLLLKSTNVGLLILSGQKIWNYKGTTADLLSSTLPWNAVWEGDGVAYLSTANGVFKTDGNTIGPVDGNEPGLLVNLVPTTARFSASILRFNGWSLYGGNTANNGFELMRNDGTASGTRMIRDIDQGPLGASPRMVIFGDRLIGVGRDVLDRERLWVVQSEAPVLDVLPNPIVDEDTPETRLLLSSYARDDIDTLSSMQFAIIANSKPELFSSIESRRTTQNLY